MDTRDLNRIWPGWETVRLLGRGSFGAVYEIRRRLGSMEEHAAVKVLTIPQSRSEIDELRMSGYDEDSLTRHFDDMKERLLREYTAMAALKGSTNIVYCDDLRTERRPEAYGWDLYIKMELLTPLTKVLGSGLSEEQALCLGRDIARALVACHREKILHRDVKPQNIFVNRDGTFKLGDFGIARTMEGSGSASARTGTYRYMAPEVYSGQHYGAGADIYSLGLVLHWLLNNGRAPFVPGPPYLPSVEDEDRALIRRFAGEPLPPPAHGSERFRRVVLKACAFDPAQRYQSAEELLRDLEKLERDDRAEPFPREEDFGTAPLPPAGAGEADDTGSTNGLFSRRPQPEPVRPDRTEASPLPPWETTHPARQEIPKSRPRPKRGLLLALVLLIAGLAVGACLLLFRGDSDPVRTGSGSSEAAAAASAAPTIALTPAPAVETPEPSPPLTAEVSLRGSASFEDVAFIDAAASSWLEQDNLYFFYPKNVIIQNSIDPWTEGVDGQGINETLTLYFDGEQTVRYLSLRLGYANNDSLFRENSRPRRLRISFSDGSSLDCEFRDTGAEQLVTLNRPVQSLYVELTILDVYPGTEFDDTCIFKVCAGR